MFISKDGLKVHSRVLNRLCLKRSETLKRVSLYDTAPIVKFTFSGKNVNLFPGVDLFFRNGNCAVVDCSQVRAV